MPSKTHIAHCAEEGCREVGLFEYSNKQESRELWQRFQKDPFRCTRHQNPEELLSGDNRERTVTMVVRAREDIGGKLFFDGSHGFVFGPGFKVFAKDWPAGTRLVVTARIEDSRDAE